MTPPSGSHASIPDFIEILILAEEFVSEGEYSSGSELFQTGVGLSITTCEEATELSSLPSQAVISTLQVSPVLVNVDDDAVFVVIGEPTAV